MRYLLDENDFRKLDIRMINLSFVVENMENYEDQDDPTKQNFHHPWRNWSGVNTTYWFPRHTTRIIGSRGKTAWYIPACTALEAKMLGVEQYQALKIVKYNIENSLEKELNRLNYEAEIQNIFAGYGVAPKVLSIVGVINLESNYLKWFRHHVYHPSNSAYLATVVEHITPEYLPEDQVFMDENFLYYGPLIDEIFDLCQKLAVNPHDLGLGNIFFSNGRLKIVDFHKWTRL